MTHPMYLGWQIDWPVFVKVPFSGYERGQHLDWRSKNIDPNKIAHLYSTGLVYHNKELEKQNKVGDRIEELAGNTLSSLVLQLNVEVKARTNSAKEFANKKCKQSVVDAKQRGLLRSFLRNNSWIEDKFFEIRDELLDNSQSKDQDIGVDV